MNKPVFKRQGLYVFLLIFAGLVFPGFRYPATQNGAIILKDEPVPIIPKEFYISNVIDERDDRNAVAWQSFLPENNPNKKNTFDLEGGGFTAIKRFIDHNLPRNTALRRIVIGLKTFRADELMLEDRHITGHVSVVMSFNIVQSDEDTVHLLDYKANTDYKRNDGPPQDIEPTLRRMLENGLVYLNTWMNREAATNIKLATAVKLDFTDYREKAEGDTIYYAVNRPLTWDDFKSKIPSRRYDAEIFPTVGYDEQTKVNKGVIDVTLAIKVALPKSASWVRDGMRNDYTLNHEQRHFDIVKIVAGHFKQKLNAQNLTVNNYEGIINFEYLETYREMDSLQKQYDDETRHGTDASAQQRWNEKIDKELREALGISSLVHWFISSLVH